MFLFVMVCCLSDFLADYLQSKTTLHEIFTLGVFQAKEQPVRFGSDLDCDPDPNYDPDLIWISQICMKLSTHYVVEIYCFSAVYCYYYYYYSSTI